MCCPQTSTVSHEVRLKWKRRERWMRRERASLVLKGLMDRRLDVKVFSSAHTAQNSQKCLRLSVWACLAFIYSGKVAISLCFSRKTQSKATVLPTSAYERLLRDHDGIPRKEQKEERLLTFSTFSLPQIRDLNQQPSVTSENFGEEFAAMTAVGHWSRNSSEANCS